MLFYFLEKLNELKESHNTPSEQLLHALPELLKEKALLLWYRNSKQRWNTWKDFI